MEDVYLFATLIALIALGAGALATLVSLVSRPPGWRQGLIWAALIAVAVAGVILSEGDTGLAQVLFILGAVALCFARLGWSLSQSRWSLALWLLAALAILSALGFPLAEHYPTRGGFLVNLGYTIAIALSAAAAAGTACGIAVTYLRRRMHG